MRVDGELAHTKTARAGATVVLRKGHLLCHGHAAGELSMVLAVPSGATDRLHRYSFSRQFASLDGAKIPNQRLRRYHAIHRAAIAQNFSIGRVARRVAFHLRSVRILS